MNCYLLEMKICGIKNISKEMILNFYNKTLKSKFDLNHSNIKSIYGPNGSGKSALINGIDIYKNLIINENYLSDSQTIRLLNELINKKTNKFSLELSFLFYSQEEMKKLKVLTHRVELKKRDGLFKISYEKLFINTGNKYDGTQGKTVIEIENGKVIYTDFNNEYSQIEKYTYNLLEKQSIVTISRNFIHQFDDDESVKKYIINLVSPFIFCMNMTVIINDSDNHYQYLMKDIDQKLIDDILFHIYIGSDIDIIPKKDYSQYQNNVLSLEKFIKIFKTNLKSIDTEYKENEEILVCRKYFNYGDYRVESEFESTGIKKLIILFNAFHDLNNGQIVFIDELDANLHDVYLCKLLEYFSIYAKGQLCFTTHNLAPMEILRKRNYSIDFLSDESTLTSWKRNGNYSVSKLYREGMIPDSPFNIDAFDFIGIFDKE